MSNSEIKNSGKAWVSIFCILRKKFSVCLFPTTIKQYKPKSTFFEEKSGEFAGKQTNQKFFPQNTKNRYSSLTRIFHLAVGQKEKKLWCFKVTLCNTIVFGVKSDVFWVQREKSAYFGKLITLWVLELCRHLGYENTSKTFKLFIFYTKIWFCLFPTKIEQYKPKSTFFEAKRGKFAGKQTKSNFFLENRQSGYSSLTRIFYLAVGPIEKKIGYFKVLLCNRGGQKILKKSSKNGHHLSLDFDVLYIFLVYDWILL